MRIRDWSSDVCSSDLEDGERIIRRVAARLERDFRESLVLRAIAFLIVAAAAAEKMRRPRRLLVLALDRMGNFGEPFHWRLAVVEDVAERAGEHLLEADGEHAVGAAERDELARKIERGRARRAVVVDELGSASGRERVCQSV